MSSFFYAISLWLWQFQQILGKKPADSNLKPFSAQSFQIVKPRILCNLRLLLTPFRKALTDLTCGAWWLESICCLLTCNYRGSLGCHGSLCHYRFLGYRAVGHRSRSDTGCGFPDTLLVLCCVCHCKKYESRLNRTIKYQASRGSAPGITGI